MSSKYESLLIDANERLIKAGERSEHLYTSRPGDGTLRVVCRGGVFRTYKAAWQHVETMISNLSKDENE